MQTKEVNGIETSFLRPDLQESLTETHIVPSKLSKFQRVILTTDGTLTEILDLLEKIQIVKLSEEVVAIAQDILPLEITVGCEVISRKILLQGKISRRNWIYAESIIVPERLDELFRERLPKKGRGQRAEGRRKEKFLVCPMLMGLKPLTLVMKKEGNMYFETRSARNTASLLKPLTLVMGFPSALCLLPSALPPLAALLKSQESIGRLWLEHKVETFKEIIDSSWEPSGDLSNYFKIQREDKLFSRTYRVFSNRKPIMMITEKFPDQFFVDV